MRLVRVDAQPGGRVVSNDGEDGPGNLVSREWSGGITNIFSSRKARDEREFANSMKMDEQWEY